MSAFGRDRYMPEGEWVRSTSRVKVAGVKFRLGNVERFIRGVKSAENSGHYYGVHIEAEPDNEFDPNAIKVFGDVSVKNWFSRKQLRLHIGYLSEETARYVNENLISQNQKVAAELFSIYVSDNGFIDINIMVLGPKGYSHKAILNRRKSNS